MTLSNAILSKPIKTIDDARDFINELIRNDLMFHFEDDPRTVFFGDDTPLAMDALDARRKELYSADIDWGEYDCPIGFSFHLEGYIHDDEEGWIKPD